MNEAQPDAPAQDPVNHASLMARLKNAWELEFSNLRWRLLVCTLLMRLLPRGRAVRLRTNLVRALGVRVGAGTRFLDVPKIQCGASGPLGPRLQIGKCCTIGSGVILEFGEVLTIGDRVSLHDRAVILTSTHQLGPKTHRAGPLVRNPVTIGDDVVIGEGAIVLPGVTIGAAVRVLPNSVINTNVAPGVTVSGIPARPVPNTPPTDPEQGALTTSQ